MVEADIGVQVLLFLYENFWFLYSLFMNFILLFIFIRLGLLYGPFFKDSLLVLFGRIKDPVITAIFTSSRKFVLEWRPYSAIQNTSQVDKTSEIVLLDRNNDVQIGSNKRSGVFSFFGKKEIPRTMSYDDKGMWVDFDDNKQFRSWGYPAHIIVQGVNKTINPYDHVTAKPETKLASHAIIEAIEGWKAYYLDKIEQDSVSKKMFILGIIVVIFFIGINMLLTSNVGAQLDGVVQYFLENKEVIDQLIEQAKQNLPRIEGA